MRFHLLLLALTLASPSKALELALSGASPTADDTMIAGSVRLPEQPWSTNSPPPPQIEGDITRTVLRSQRGTRTTLQLLAPLRDQLSAAGFEPIFSCADRACGGFDFRFQLDLLGAPEMFVDLGDFRYLLMRRDAKEPHTVSIVTSRSSGAGFVHVTTVSTPTLGAEETSSAVSIAQPMPEEGDLIASLLAEGHVVLSDLDFESGSATLGDDGIASLTMLAEWLSATPNARIALVGHTDSVGSADGNRALSQRRAETVRARLIFEGDIEPSRIEAAGVGYLAPVAPNTTEDGRAMNRRVEAILLSIE